MIHTFHQLTKDGQTLYRIYDVALETYGQKEFTETELEEFLLFQLLDSAIRAHRMQQKHRPVSRFAKKVDTWPEVEPEECDESEDLPPTHPDMIEFNLTELLSEVATAAVMAELAKHKK